MTLPELLRAAREGAVSELELISLEGGIYLLQILGAEQRGERIDFTLAPGLCIGGVADVHRGVRAQRRGSTQLSLCGK